MAELAEFQGEFGRALFDRQTGATASWVASLGAGVTVHRNTVFKALVDALEANYPTVAQLTGREWFRACAAEFAQAHPPRSPALVRYGQAFASFLAGFEPAAGLPYLAEVARIDWLWIEAHTASDAKCCTPASLRRLNATELQHTKLPLHPATRFGWFKHSAATIWIHHRSEQPAAALEVDGEDEGLVLTRPVGAVDHAKLDRPGFTLLARLHARATLGEAATSALEMQPDIDIRSRLAQLIASGAFAELQGSYL